MTEKTAAELDARSQLIGVAILLLGGVLIGLAPIGLRFAVADGLTAQTTAFWRFLLTLPVLLLVFAVRQRVPHKPNKWAILAGVFFALDIGFWHLALTITSVANATFIVNVGNIGVGFLAWIFLKDRPTIFWGLAILLALVGAYLLSSGASKAGGTGGFHGDVLALVAAVFVSFYMLFASLARRSLGALDVLFWATLAEMVVAAIMSLAFGDPLLPPDLGALSVPLFLAVFVQIGGQGCIIYGVGRAPAAIAGVMLLVQPVTAGMISWFLFGETLSPIQLSGAGLILIGIVVAQLRQRRSPAT